jgi:hypothetical protein
MLNIRKSRYVNPLKTSRYYVYHQVWSSKKILRYAHRVHVCVLDGSQAKQLLLPCIAEVSKSLTLYPANVDKMVGSYQC